ncbi:Putative NAD(+)--arginine ADP-ribosyltransferase Mav [Rhizoctonia solani]|uniref:Putative NAD(+)--arginine ADP-ribosyltransferase Mav n=1 Tax=Rhizoctonia solani TaxID=456999 RepID=A0A0K6FPT3_9AGAM|nr:Putative NAD(+)--arginine ADP-ribosyltransferase Mav [Rhizoctonia solani]
MVPYDPGLKALEVTSYQIVIVYEPANRSVIVGFDDFAPAWPTDDVLSREAIQRRDKYREMAQFRALVKIKKVKYLSAEGIERLRDAGADVSDEACRQGLWIAVYGKYDNYPSYLPGEKNKPTKHLLEVQVIHRDERQTMRKLYIASMDPRTAVRSFLYFERIKLIRSMEEISKQDNGRTEIEDRNVEWFVKKIMEMFPTDETSVPEKRDNYRGARRHTSEVRHVLVCHAEWLLTQSKVYRGTDRYMSKRVLEEWVDLAPQMREMAAREERAGWGVWDAVWDKVDFVEHRHKEEKKFNYYLKVLKQEERTKPIPPSSRSGRSALRSAQVNKGKGRATTADEETYAYRWIPDPVSEEEDDGGFSQDETEWIDRVKRPRIDLSRDAGPSGARLSHSSPSLGDGDRPEDRMSSSLSRNLYQPGPSLTNRTPSSSRVPTATSQLPPRSTRGSTPRASTSSNRNPSSSWKSTSQKGPSPTTPPTSHKSPDTSRSHLSAQAPPQSSETADVIDVSSDVIWVSSDEDLAADVARSSIAPRNDVIDITDSPSEGGDESMRAVSDMDDLEDDQMQGHSNHDEPPYPGQRTSVLRETVIAETPPPGTRPQPSFSRPRSPPVEEIDDSQDEFNSSDSESKYGPRPPRPLTPKRQRIEKLKKLNDEILLFAPMVNSTVYVPQTWHAWKCNYPSINLGPGSDPKVAQTITCAFKIELSNPSLEVQRLLNEDIRDAEFLKHIMTKPCIFKGPTDELAVAIFERVVELHREDHFRRWGVKRVITDIGGAYRAHFEPLNEDDES